MHYPGIISGCFFDPDQTTISYQGIILALTQSVPSAVTYPISQRKIIREKKA
jgi:hypothetical protein